MANNPPALTIVTEGLLDIEVRGSNISEEAMRDRLDSPGVFHAIDQSGRVIELSIDMDMESLAAELITFKRTAPPFVVGTYHNPEHLDVLVAGEPVITDPNQIRTFDGHIRNVIGREPFDALVHAHLLPDIAQAQCIRLPDDRRELVDLLQEHGRLNLPLAVSLEEHLVDMATQHRWLCAADIATGLSDAQKQAQQALEDRLETFATELDGITGAYLNGDPRGTTMGLRFESGISNSLTGAYKIPSDPVIYKLLDKRAFWDEIVATMLVDHVDLPSP
ncbi:MAG: hypothetical protein ACREPQ_00845 [Rhodanobacter sp.]